MTNIQFSSKSKSKLINSFAKDGLLFNSLGEAMNLNNIGNNITGRVTLKARWNRNYFANPFNDCDALLYGLASQRGNYSLRHDNGLEYCFRDTKNYTEKSKQKYLRMMCEENLIFRLKRGTYFLNPAIHTLYDTIPVEVLMMFNKDLLLTDTNEKE